MAVVAAVANAVRQHWLAHGLRVSPVDPEALARLKVSHSEGIPEEYEAFLRIAGLPDDEDGAGFRFWLPHEVRATSDVLREAVGSACHAEHSVIIADYLHESWWYALWLTGPLRGQVSLVLGAADGKDPRPPLGALVDFLLAYMNDDEHLYP